MDHTVIRYRVDLILSFVDTTNGNVIRDRNLIIKNDDKIINVMTKGDGTYIVCNRERENMWLTADIPGYETAKAYVNYEEIDKVLPSVELHMIPKMNTANSGTLCEINGNIKGIRSIEAVSVYDDKCRLSEYDERKRIMSLVNPHMVYMDKIYYGLINYSLDEYEPFSVVKVISNASIKIKPPLEKEWTINSNIARRIFGSVDSEGNYLLRVRDGSQKAKYIVRYEVGEKIKYKVVDFNVPDTLILDDETGGE